MTYGSKQNQHIISRGLLGDGSERYRKLGRMLMMLPKDSGKRFGNKQWERALIIRANKAEYHVLPHIDKVHQRLETSIKLIPGVLSHTDTENRSHVACHRRSPKQVRRGTKQAGHANYPKLLQKICNIHN